MTTFARTQTHTTARADIKIELGFALRLPFLLILLPLAWLMGEGTPRAKFSGSVGDDESLERYGDLTPREHAEIGANT